MVDQNLAQPPSAGTLPEQLARGPAIHRTIRTGETQRYRMKAEGALFVHLLINQASADVATRIRRSYGSTLFEVDATETGWESVPILLDAPGDYLVEIERRDKNAGGGQYQLEVREMRQSLESDHPHVDAARLATETRRVVGERKPGAQEAALRVSCFGE